MTAGAAVVGAQEQRAGRMVVDVPVVRAQPWSGRSGRRLRAVPAQAGPVAPLELGNPLQLTARMRARLVAAVRALVASPALAGASDVARLASVVLMAKAKVRDGYETKIWAAELGRWLGVSRSTVAHTVLPELRSTGLLGSKVATNAFGHATGLECWVIPMYRAQQAGDRRHALALSRSELAVLLRLIEVLFGPGWAPKDKAPVPAGILARRTGRGAATDRLALLLMVLTTGSKGWLKLCPGPVDTGRGRPAATVGRLLGCTAAAGAKVLKRLQQHGVADVVRQETGSGLNARSRVRLVPVAQAHGVAARGARRVADAVLSDLAGTASGDLESCETGGTLVATGIEGAGQDGTGGSANLAATAQHHALHPCVVTPGGSLGVSGGFSGERRGAKGRRPERAYGREEAAPDDTDRAAPPLTLVGADPLRGEKPFEPPLQEIKSRSGKTGWWPAVAGGRTRQQRRTALPDDLRLRVALGPVEWLWRRLSHWQQDQVQAAVVGELNRLEGLLMSPQGAPRLLADRLTRRLEETGGEVFVGSPYGWITRRGLVQRPACSDQRCDDGIRLDTGAQCGRCGNVLHVRRAHRLRITAEVDRELPGLDDDARRRAVEERLRRQAGAEAADFVRRREQAAVEQAMRDAARTAAWERAERDRLVRAAADAAGQAKPCADCGLEAAAGLCEACGHWRETENLIWQAGLFAATWSSSPTDTVAIAVAAAGARTGIERAIARSWREFLDITDAGEAAADAATVRIAQAFNAFETARQEAGAYEQYALCRMGLTQEADTEARRVYLVEQNRRWFRAVPGSADAIAAATQAAEAARQRTAQHLLAARLEQLRDQSPPDAGAAPIVTGRG
ncbi:hypothetical protein ACFQ7N_10190 [Streptomyces niveus]|uniref:hypothetical protein n=1 Tax=Streptomyces niveus TaxID=193462 RepID=UPI00369FCB5D